MEGKERTTMRMRQMRSLSDAILNEKYDNYTILKLLIKYVVQLC